MKLFKKRSLKSVNAISINTWIMPSGNILVGIDEINVTPIRRERAKPSGKLSLERGLHGCENVGIRHGEFTMDTN
jgi:hypothetical protein